MGVGCLGLTLAGMSAGRGVGSPRDQTDSGEPEPSTGPLRSWRPERVGGRWRATGRVSRGGSGVALMWILRSTDVSGAIEP
jgi:hypothetical protein